VDKLFSKLRIGEKIAIGFMVVGLLLAAQEVVQHLASVQKKVTALATRLSP